MRFVECLLLHCLLTDSPPADADERKANGFNHSRAACCGRTPGIKLLDGGKERDLREWAIEICTSLLPLAELLDAGGGSGYANSVRARLAEAGNAELTPSARVLTEMRDRREAFFDFAMRYSQAYYEAFAREQPSLELKARFEGMARRSHASQAEIEAADSIGFEQYLQQYFAQA